MFYIAENELILNGPRNQLNRSKGRHIHREQKKNQWGKLNYLIDGEIRQNDLVTRYKDAHSHTVNDVFSMCPMYLNFLSLRGYKKVLFVGHFLASQRSWTFPRKSDRNIFDTPSYHATQDTMVDPNIVMQFMPIVKMAYRGYNNFEMHTLQPPESRHTQLMHALYKRYEIHLVPCSKQYKHGRTIDITPPPDTQYDAVVFAGVPKDAPELGFSVHHIRSVFQPYCKVGFDIIDMNYQDPDPHKYYDSRAIKNEDYINELFVNRSIWDRHFRLAEPEDRNIEYQILNNTINCYPG